jgi:chemotaxis protein CheD
MNCSTAARQDAAALLAETSQHFYFDTTFQRRAVKILPGEFYVATDDTLLVTVLGSCVSACIRDRFRSVGGMNHFMLPARAEAGVLSASMRYGAYAMEVLINQLYRAGARREHLEIKVFGGACVLPGLSTIDVGERNSRFVLDYLSEEGFPVAAHDLGDAFPRKVYFAPASGEIMVRRLRASALSDDLAREASYARQLDRSAHRPTSSLQLF